MLRWIIEFKVFQSVRGLEDDSVTRFVRKLDLPLEIRDLTKLHWARSEFLAVKGRFPSVEPPDFYPCRVCGRSLEVRD